MWKQRKSINYRQENANTSCLGSKTGSDPIFNFTIAFHIQRNILPEKMARINQLRAGKRWHFLFREQKRKQRHFWLHHGVLHPEKPSPWESSVNQAITSKKNVGTSCLASKSWSDDISGFIIVFRIPRYPLPEKTAGINQLQTGKRRHFLFDEQNRKWSHLELHHRVQHP